MKENNRRARKNGGKGFWEQEEQDESCRLERGRRVSWTKSDRIGGEETFFRSYLIRETTLGGGGLSAVGGEKQIQERWKGNLERAEENFR